MHGIRLIWVPFLIPNWAAGQTWGRFILLNRQHAEHVNAGLIAHELVHVMQWRQHGILGFAWKYLTGLIKHGYKAHPFELEADATWPLYLEQAAHLMEEQL